MPFTYEIITGDYCKVAPLFSEYECISCKMSRAGSTFQIGARTYHTLRITAEFRRRIPPGDCSSNGDPSIREIEEATG